MPNRALHVPRPRLLSPEQLDRIDESAACILSEIGLHVRSEEALAAARRAGLRLEGDRVHPDRAVFDEFIAHTRAHQPTPDPDSDAQGDPELVLTVCQYATHRHDPDTDAILPYTTEALIEAAKFVDTMASRAVIGKAPGCPMDAPPDLQALLQYKIGALYCRHGRGPVEIRSPRAMPYIMDLAEALGRPYLQQAVYVVSPLTLGGDSFDCALAGRDRLESIWVSNMSSAGASAPIRIADALALAVAEVVGSAIVAREVTGLPVEWSVRVCPLDFQTLALSQGSPEELLFQWAFEEVNAFYHGLEPRPQHGSLHTQAKLPGTQAAAEKMALLLPGALLGARTFTGAGRLSLDEVFSAEQLLIDCEMRDYVQRLVSGLDTDCDPEACVAEVAAGLADGFLSLESTAHTYRRVHWLPQLFERRALSGWSGAGSPDLRAQAKDLVRRQLQQHDYELEPDLRREVERIYQQAERELSG